MDDPKRRMSKPDDEPEAANTIEQTMALMAQILMELRSNKGGDDLTRKALEQQLAHTQKLIEKTIPENKVAPLVSVYSHPEGETARPKDKLRCKTVWVGRELTGDVETPEEIELLNRVKPGKYF